MILTFKMKYLYYLNMEKSPLSALLLLFFPLPLPPEEPQEVSWDSIYKAFRKKGCIYLYVTPAKAFLLPSKQADAPDYDVWEFIRDHLGREKCKG